MAERAANVISCFVLAEIYRKCLLVVANAKICVAGIYRVCFECDVI